MKRFFARKRNILIIVIVLIVAGILFSIFKRGDDGGILTDTVKKQDIRQTVLATGQVVSSTDLALSFQASGMVKAVNVKVGDKVKNGQTLAALDQKNQLAALEQARGARDSAQANYDKVVRGAIPEDIEVSKAAVVAAQTALDNANASYSTVVAQQKILVENARLAWLNSGLSADRLVYYDTSATLTITGAYTAIEEGEYTIKLNPDGGSGFTYNVAGLEISVGAAVKGIPLPFGTRGLYMTFSTTGSFSGVDSWRVSIPNTQASAYVANYNAYQSALQTQAAALVSAQNTINSAQTALTQARAALALKQAAAQPEEVAAAKASVISALGQVAAAAAGLENTIIRTPTYGTVTRVDVKIGELATALAPVMVLQDISNLHVEANISEANVAQIAPGQEVEVTFDAFGSERKHQAKVLAVDPASSVVSGVINYKVIFSLDNLPDVKPGMTANLVILTAEAAGVLVVPQRGLIVRDGKQFIRVIIEGGALTYEEREIVTGLEGDGGLVEVISGLSEGQAVVTFIKK